MDTYMDGFLFKNIRKHILKVSQMHLSDLLGISERYVSQLESGERPIASSYALSMEYLANLKGVVVSNEYTKHLKDELLK